MQQVLESSARVKGEIELFADTSIDQLFEQGYALKVEYRPEGSDSDITKIIFDREELDNLGGWFGWKLRTHRSQRYRVRKCHNDHHTWNGRGHLQSPALTGSRAAKS